MVEVQRSGGQGDLMYRLYHEGSGYEEVSESDTEILIRFNIADEQARDAP